MKTNYQNQSKMNPALSLTIIAMVIAFRLALSYIPSFKFGNYAEIGVGFIGAALAAVLLGPWRAAGVGAVVDILSFFLTGGGLFFPGYTLSAALGGLLYGLMLYKKEPSFLRVLVTVSLVTLIINLGLGSLWIHLLYGKAFEVFMGVRIIKNLISWPINTLVLYLLLNNDNVKRIINKYRL